MMQLLLDFWRNFHSGLRIAFGLPASLLDFRVTLRQLVLFLAIDVSSDVLIDYLRAGTDAVFSAHAVVYEGFITAVLLLTSSALSAAYRQPHLKLAIPVLVLASLPALDLLQLILTLPGTQGALHGLSIQWLGFWVFLAWLAFIYWRAVATALAPPKPWFWVRSLGGAALLLAAVPLAIWAYQPWWEAPEQQTARRDSNYVSPASEQALTAQSQMLSDALDDIEDERPGTTDLYFVGFAPYSGEDVFRKDMDVARELMDERFDTDGRSIVLINSPYTVLDQPLATVSNLRQTLEEIGSAIDADDDVVMLYLESHGTRDHKLVVDFPPLELDQLTPEALREMLDDAGIKWRIIVVSACYSGGFIDALKDEHTLIITASAANRTSFGCGNGSAATYFGDALFQHALRFEDSFVKAFEQAKQRIAERERAEHRKDAPSDPQIYVGAAMADKLPKLEAALRARRSGNTI
ncbi:MAG TPA: C13 family peptidase [Casimicrobiaceae bacterium]|nr:C13 family peptidase [Casimicrobiaceae bacterium]